MDVFQPLRILIVEDEGMIAMDIEATVEDEGHVVVGWAMSADEAIRLYDADPPDIVFLDIHLLNGSSGLDVARELKKRPDARFVFITANPGKIDEDASGGIGVLAKPFSSAQLLSTLRYLQQGMFDPPPSLAVPQGLRLGLEYRAAWS